MTMDMFSDGRKPDRAPLADRMRPRTLAEVAGQDHLTAEGKLLDRVARGATLPSLIFWGPQGTGKTTLARLLAETAERPLHALSAVSAGVADVRKIVAAARVARGGSVVLFLDEIHRFNKAQQDALLPHVESGAIVLFGATTENPSFEVNGALLSRCRVVVTRSLEETSLQKVLDGALSDVERGLGEREVILDPEARRALVAGADGDARRLLTTLEIASELGAAPDSARIEIDSETVREAMQVSTLRYDRASEEHFNLISALQKSIRASDPQGATYWVGRMLASGEDPLYVARRLVRTAVEDVGLADPEALVQATAAHQAAHFLGLPEGGLALHQCAIYLALAPKSNAVTLAEAAVNEAIEYAGSLPAPPAFRNAPTQLLKDLGYGRGYRYDHDAPDGFAGQSGLPPEIRSTQFYRPSSRGREGELGTHLRELERRRSLKEPD